MESKVKESKVVEKVDNTDNGAVEKVDYKDKWKEIRENLIIQHKESMEQIEIHKTKANKIQGTIEVNDQMFAEEENSDS